MLNGVQRCTKIKNFESFSDSQEKYLKMSQCFWGEMCLKVLEKVTFEMGVQRSLKMLEIFGKRVLIGVQYNLKGAQRSPKVSQGAPKKVLN